MVDQEMLTKQSANYVVLAGADYVESDLAYEPVPTPEILGAVESPTEDAYGAEGMAPREGSGGELRTGGDRCQGPPPCLSHFEQLPEGCIVGNA